MNVVINPKPIFSASAEALSDIYHQHIGKSGRTWLVGTSDPAGHIYVQTADPRGFGGRPLEFTLTDGQKVTLHGPWHSNPDSLYQDTGVDVRAQHLSQVVISRSRRYDGHQIIMEDVLHHDTEPQPGRFNRGETLTRRMANELSETLYFYSESRGGSVFGLVRPEEKECRR